MNLAEKTGIETTELASGVRVVTERLPSMRSISVGLWVANGSRDEPANLSGISHFIEHMVFKGTRKRRTHHIAQRMEAVGGYLNAFTSKEYTCYYARALDEHLERSVDIVCDLVFNPTFPEREVEKEKDVVVEEMRMYDDVPEDLLFDRYEGVLFDGHSLARPVIGYPETVRSFSQSDLFGYLENRYTPDRIVVAAAGNLTHARVVRLVEQALEKAERPPNPSSHARDRVNGYTPKHLIENRPIQQAHLVLGTRGLDINDRRRMTMSLLNTVLGGGMSSRLNQNIREKYGYCYHIYSFANMLSDTGDFGVYMATDGAKVERSKKLIFRELDKLVQKPMSRQKLSQAQSQLKGALMLGLESLSNRMMRLGRMVLYDQPFRTLDEIIGSIEAVNETDLQDLAGDLFDPEQFSSAVL
ncbi:MAG: pitrilysin family protein, partial [Bacteroidota bacterium]